MRLALLFLTASLAWAQPKPILGFGTPDAGFYWHGPKTVYPGYTAYYSFSPGLYRVAVACASTGNTCDTAGSGYVPLGTETNVYVTAATRPTGIDTMTEGVLAPYDICNVTATTKFQLCRHGTATVETFSSTGSGVSIVFLPAALAGSAGWYVPTATAASMGWPAGTTVTWGNVNGIGGNGFDAGFLSPNGYPYLPAGFASFPQALKVDVPSNATPGDYPIAILDCDQDPVMAGACPGGSNSDTLSFTVTVTALSPAPGPGPSVFPVIPGLSTWISYMTSASGLGGGGDWCNKTTGITVPADLSTEIGSDNSIFYYDGAHTYSLIAQWLNDSDWNNCAHTIEQQSGLGIGELAAPTLNYITVRFPGYRFFPAGFAFSYYHAPTAYLQVLQYMTGYYGMNCCGDAAIGDGGYISDVGIRETAYGLEIMLTMDDLALTPPDPPGTSTYRLWATRRQRMADMLIGDLNAYTEGSGRYVENQFFFDGTAMHALIHWWQSAAGNADPRVPMVVKKTIDLYWSKFGVGAANLAAYNADPDGIYCLEMSNWYAPADDGCVPYSAADGSVLHNLVSFAFAWYWRLSGTTAYQTEGDTVFSHAFDGQDGIKGKTFSQIYRYSFDYVAYRQGLITPQQGTDILGLPLSSTNTRISGSVTISGSAAVH